MSEVRQEVSGIQARPQAGPRDLRQVLLRVAWMSIALGILMQLLLVLVRLGNIPGTNPLIADFAQKITWTFVVCMGLAVGTGITQTNPPLMGLSGLISAPLGFYLARSVHGGVSEFLGLDVATTGGANATTAALLRGVQYLCLGLFVGWLAKQNWAGLLAHMGAGLALGLVFGGGLILIQQQQIATGLALFSWAVNELIFPMGCALILFVSDALARRLPG